MHFVDWPNYEFESCNEKSGEGEVTCRHVKGKSLFAFASSASSVELVGWVLQLHTTKYCASNGGLVYGWIDVMHKMDVGFLIDHKSFCFLPPVPLLPKISVSGLVF